MANESQKHAETAAKINDYVERLDEEHKMLVVLKSQLYEGSWDAMLEDLDNRLTGKPYIFKLANRIKDDKLRIQEMKAFEQDHDIDLADYVELT